MGHVKKVHPGEPWRPAADAHNAFVDAARYVEQLKASGGARTGPDQWQTTILQVKNNSGAALDRFNILGIDDVFPTPTNNLDTFKNVPVLHGVTPTTADHFGRFAVLLEPAADGAIVAACVSGVCVCQVNVTDENATTADVKDGDAVCLETGGAGSATILWKESGAGIVWAVVRVGNTAGEYDRCKGLLKGALDSGDSTTTVDNVTVIRGTSPLDDPTDTTEELTVSNADHEWDGDDNAVCRFEWNQTAERWEFYQITCPA